MHSEPRARDQRDVEPTASAPFFMMASPGGTGSLPKDSTLTWREGNGNGNPSDRQSLVSREVSTPSSGSKQSKHEYRAQRKQYDVEKKQRRNKAMVRRSLFRMCERVCILCV